MKSLVEENYNLRKAYPIEKVTTGWTPSCNTRRTSAIHLDASARNVGDLSDPHLSARNGKVCQVCGGTDKQCHTHPSHIELSGLYIMPQDRPFVVPILGVACQCCSQLLTKTGSWSRYVDETLLGLYMYLPIPDTPQWCKDILARHCASEEHYTDHHMFEIKPLDLPLLQAQHEQEVEKLTKVRSLTSFTSVSVQFLDHKKTQATLDLQAFDLSRLHAELDKVMIRELLKLSEALDTTLFVCSRNEEGKNSSSPPSWGTFRLPADIVPNILEEIHSIKQQQKRSSSSSSSQLYHVPSIATDVKESELDVLRDTFLQGWIQKVQQHVKNIPPLSIKFQACDKTLCAFSLSLAQVLKVQEMLKREEKKVFDVVPPPQRMLAFLDQKKAWSLLYQQGLARYSSALDRLDPKKISKEERYKRVKICWLRRQFLVFVKTQLFAVDKEVHCTYTNVFNRLNEELLRQYTIQERMDQLLGTIPFESESYFASSEHKDPHFKTRMSTIQNVIHPQKKKFQRELDRTLRCIADLQRVLKHLRQLIQVRVQEKEREDQKRREEKKEDVECKRGTTKYRVEQALVSLTKGAQFDQEGHFVHIGDQSLHSWNIGKMYAHKLAPTGTKEFISILKCHQHILWKVAAQRTTKILYCAMGFGGCGTAQYEINVRNSSFVAHQHGTMRYTPWVQASIFEGKVVPMVDNGTIWRILRNVSDEDVRLLGFDPVMTHPASHVLTCLPAPHPSIVIGSVTSSIQGALSGTRQDVIWVETNHIAKKEKRQRELRARKEKQLGRTLLFGEWMRKQHCNKIDYDVRRNYILIACMIQACQKPENQGFPRVPDLLIQSNIAAKVAYLATIQDSSHMQRLNSKQGTVRDRMMARRVDFACRLVTTNSPRMKQDECQVGGGALRLLFRAVYVTENNIHAVCLYADWIQSRRKELHRYKTDIMFAKQRQSMQTHDMMRIDEDLRYGDVYPTVRFLIDTDEHKFNLSKTFGKTYASLIHVGCILEVSLQPGDALIFNRQPSLRREGFIVLRVRRFVPNESSDIPTFLSNETSRNHKLLPSYVRTTPDERKCLKREGGGRLSTHTQTMLYDDNALLLEDIDEEEVYTTTYESEKHTAIRRTFEQVVGLIDERPLDNHKVIGVNPNIVTAPNLDFDGDVASQHLVQTAAATCEATTLMTPDNYFVTQQDRTSLGHAIQHTLDVFFKATRWNVLFREKDFIEAASRFHSIQYALQVIRGNQVDLELAHDLVTQNRCDIPPRWDARHLVSRLLPSGLFYERNITEEDRQALAEHKFDLLDPEVGWDKCLIRDGQLILGCITEEEIGQGEHTLITELVRSFGTRTTKIFLNDLMAFTNWWSHRFLTSLGMDDLLVTLEERKEMNALVCERRAEEHKQLSALQSEWDAKQHYLLHRLSLIHRPSGAAYLQQKKFMERNHNVRLAQLVGRLGVEHDNALLAVLKRIYKTTEMTPHRSVLTDDMCFNLHQYMSLGISGAKGGKGKWMQTIMSLGQTTVEGKPLQRILPDKRWGQLRRRNPKILSLREWGFVSACFLRGLGLESYIAHAMAGKFNVAAATADISITGKIHRTLNAMVGRQSTQKNGTISEMNHKVIVMETSGSSLIYDRAVQFPVDAWDAEHGEQLQALMEGDGEEVKKEKRTEEEARRLLMRQDWATPGLEEEFQTLCRLCSDLSKRRKQHRLWPTSTKVYLPLDVISEIEMVRRSDETKDAKTSQSSSRDAALKFLDRINDQSHMALMVQRMVTILSIMDAHTMGLSTVHAKESKRVFLLKTYIYQQMNTRRLVDHWKLSVLQVYNVCASIIKRFNSSRDQPGVLVGGLAASAIGEMCTQSFLNIKHFLCGLVEMSGGVKRIRTLIYQKFVASDVIMKCKLLNTTHPLANVQDSFPEERLQQVLEQMSPFEICPEMGVVDNAGLDLWAMKDQWSLCPEYSDQDVVNAQCRQALRVDETKMKDLKIQISKEAARIVLDAKACATHEYDPHISLRILRGLLPALQFGISVWYSHPQQLYVVYIHLITLNAQGTQLLKKDCEYVIKQLVTQKKQKHKPKSKSKLRKGEEEKEGEGEKEDDNDEEEDEEDEEEKEEQEVVEDEEEKEEQEQEQEEKEERNEEYEAEMEGINRSLDRQERYEESLTEGSEHLRSPLITYVNNHMYLRVLAAELVSRIVPQTGIKAVSKQDDGTIFMQVDPKANTTGKFQSWFARPEVVTRTGYITSPLSTMHTFGIAAATQCMLKELVDGTVTLKPICERHLALVSLWITHTGQCKGLNRKTLAEMAENWLEEVPYERTSERLYRAPIEGKDALMNGLLGCVMAGQPPRTGTHASDIHLRDFEEDDAQMDLSA